VSIEPIFAAVASALDETAQHVGGTDSSTHGQPLEITGARLAHVALKLGLTGRPQLILPVWAKELAAPPHGPTVRVLRPHDGVIAFWADSDVTLLAISKKKESPVMVLTNGEIPARAVSFQRRRTVVPGLAASNGATHLAVGMRMANAHDTSDTDRARPYFDTLVARMSGALG